MPNLFSKDEDLLRSAPVVGFEILKMLQEAEESRVSIFEAARKMKRSYKSSVRVMYYGMLFLYSLELIEFNEPYIILKNDKN